MSVYRDLLVDEADGKLRMNLLNRDGTVALHDVCVDISSPVLQEGNGWGAREANLLLELDAKGVPQLKIDGGTY